MKKFIGLVFSGVALFALSGCGGSDDYYPDDLTTLFLVDQDGYSYAGIPYKCESMRDWDTTRPNGEFSFYPGEDCEFDFYGLDGDYDIGPEVDDIVRIVDYLDYGKGDIPYECSSFNVGNINYTYSDGSFKYDIDDECVFYF